MHKPNGKKMYLLFSNILLACLLLGVLAPAHAAQIESAFPLYYQVDYPEPLFEWRGEQKSVASSGCGAVCVAMVLSHFYQDTSYTPSALFRWANENSLYRGNGLSLAAIQQMTNEHGVAGYWQMLSKKSLVRVLTEGKLVIAAMGKGVFANTGHYIVLRGIAENGELLVADPNSEKKSLRTFSVDLIKKEAKGGKPFLVCEPPVSHPLITDNK